MAFAASSTITSRPSRASAGYCQTHHAGAHDDAIHQAGQFVCSNNGAIRQQKPLAGNAGLCWWAIHGSTCDPCRVKAVLYRLS